MDFNVSVIIPVYKAEKYIRRAIDSVLLQTEVTELILIIDGIFDRSGEICSKMRDLDDRIVILYHRGNKNKGVSASRNRGIKHAKNEFIAFLDADDYYLPNRFQRTKQCFASDHTVDGVYEGIALHSDPHNIKPFSLLKSVSHKSLFNSLSPIGFDGWFHCNGFTVRKSVFEKSGLFDEDLRTSEDTLLWLKMAACCKLISSNLTQPVAITDRTIGSLSSNKKQVNKDQITMLYKLLSWLNSSHVEDAQEKEELTINTIIRLRYSSNINLLYRTMNIARLLYSLGRIDYSFLWRSKGVRRIIGSFIGYNNVLEVNS